jgi:hypothetical protein
VFNGDFEEGALNRSWLLQYSAGGLATNLTGDLPGWSFHGGRFEKNYAPGDRLIALANGQHAAMLDDDNSWIQHNRMVVPDWAEYLSFDVQVLDAGDGETLRVSAYLPDSDSWIFLGAVAIDSEGNAFVNRLLEVPVELRGRGADVEVLAQRGWLGRRRDPARSCPVLARADHRQHHRRE